MLRILLFAAACLLAGAATAQCALSGRISDNTGKPLPGAQIFLVQTQQGGVADGDGRYTVANVAPGTYTAEVSFLGYQSQRQALTVPEGSTQLTINISLGERAFTLSELVVSATRAQANTPMTYTNVQKEDLEKLNLGLDVPYLLRWTPSAVVTSDAGTGIGYTGIRIRGSDPERINVTINGIPLNDAESQRVYWVNLPDFASSVSDIQIQRGVGTSTNGAGAFGASINLNTLQSEPEPYARMTATTGSFNTYRGNVAFGTGLINDKFSIEGRMSRLSSDGYIDRASADLRSYYLAGMWRDNKNVLRVNLFSGQEVTYQAWYGVPADLVKDPKTRTFNPAGTEKEGAPHDNEVDNYGQTHLQVLYDRQLAPQWLLHVAGHYTKGQGYFEQYKAAQRFGGYGLTPIMLGDTLIDRTDLIRRRWLDNDFYGGIYSLRYQGTDGRLEATLGGGYHIYQGAHFGEVTWARFAADSEIGQRYYDNDAQKRDFNTFLKVNYKLTPALNSYVDLQVRRVGYDFLGFNQNLEQVDQQASMTFFNPKAGLFYQLSKRAEAYASFGVARREPNRNDYTDNLASARPMPEHLYNTELGFQQRWGKAALGINLYHMYYRDQLTLNGQLNDVGEYVRVNVPDSYRAGVELTLGAELLPALRLNGTATLSRNRVLAFTEYVDVYDADFEWQGQAAIVRGNTDLPFSPAAIGAAELAWDVLHGSANQSLELSLSGKYVGVQYLDLSSDDANVLDPYFFSDLRVRYLWRPSFAKEIGLTLLVQNLFGSLYETNGWSYRYQFDGATYLDRGLYPQAGRNFLLGLSIGF